MKTESSPDHLGLIRRLLHPIRQQQKATGYNRNINSFNHETIILDALYDNNNIVLKKPFKQYTYLLTVQGS